MSPLHIGIIGSRNTGKSTLTVKVCNALISSGKNVKIIKFSHSHYSFESNTKDSAIFHESKAKDVIFTSPFETVLYKKTKTRLSIKDLNKFISKETDIILCESYPSNFPTIPSIYTIKGKTDYSVTKVRYKDFNPFLLSGIYADNHSGDIDGIPILNAGNKSELAVIINLILNLEEKSSTN